MRILGRLEQDGGISTIDETLIFATKVKNSKNFYVGLPGGIFGGTVYGYAMPYAGRLQAVVASVRDPIETSVTIYLRCINTDQTFWSGSIEPGKTSVYVKAGCIEIPESTCLGCYAESVQNFSDPVVRAVISKKL